MKMILRGSVCVLGTLLTLSSASPALAQKVTEVPDLTGKQVLATLANPATAVSVGEIMGTTVVGALISGSRLVVANAGDSRLYVFADGRLTQVTRDDTWAATVLASQQNPNAAPPSEAMEALFLLTQRTKNWDAGAVITLEQIRLQLPLDPAIMT